MFLVVFYWVVIKTKLNIFIIAAIPCDYFLYMWILMNIFLHVVREKTLRAVATHGHSTSSTSTRVTVTLIVRDILDSYRY
jgi:hypothetical protein